jgi:hypothetical protein
MMTSSAPRLEIPGSGIETVPESLLQADFLTSVDSQSPLDSGVTTSIPLSAPSISVYGAAYAATRRILARRNTMTVKKQEMKHLLAERQTLLDKKFNGTMTRRDENRLEYVRWSLGRIQDATSGQSLDALESIVGAYENFLAEMRNFGRELNEAVRTHRENNRSTNRSVNKRRR